MDVYFGHCDKLEAIVPGELVARIEQIDGVVLCMDCYSNSVKWHPITIWYIGDVITEVELKKAVRAF